MTIENVFKLFQDFWQCCKKLWDIKGTDEYWEEVVGTLGEFSRKYDNSQFVRDLALALSQELERRWKDEMRG